MQAICQDTANAQEKPSASFRHRKQELGADAPHSPIPVSHWQSAPGITFLLALTASPDSGRAVSTAGLVHTPVSLNRRTLCPGSRLRWRHTALADQSHKQSSGRKPRLNSVAAAAVPVPAGRLWRGGSRKGPVQAQTNPSSLLPAGWPGSSPPNPLPAPGPEQIHELPSLTRPPAIPPPRSHLATGPWPLGEVSALRGAHTRCDYRTPQAAGKPCGAACAPLCRTGQHTGNYKCQISQANLQLGFPFSGELSVQQTAASASRA